MATTRYEVRDALTGAHVCGPYTKRGDAEREQKRLNDEAISGRGAEGPLNRRARPIMHLGQPVRFDVVTVSGVVVDAG